MSDPSDKNATETALREANEEAGFKLNDLSVLAQLSPLITSNNVIITPVLAFYDQGEFEPDLAKDEVDMIFDLPTDRFINSTDHNVKTVKMKDNDEYSLHYFKDKVNKDTIVETWGMTALISIIVSTMLHSRAPGFLVDPKFDFKNDNINEYLEWNLLRNVERIKSVNNRRKK